MVSFENHLVNLGNERLRIDQEIETLRALREEIPDLEVRELTNSPLSTVVLSSTVMNTRITNVRCGAAHYNDDGKPFAPLAASLYVTIGTHRVYSNPPSFTLVDVIPNEEMELEPDNLAQFRETNWRRDMEALGVPSSIISEITKYLNGVLVSRDTSGQG